MNITAKELKEQDPTRFEHEYYKWCEYACDYDWWDGEYAYFKEQAEARGAYVDDIEFSVSWSQSDYASWRGSVELDQWLKTSDAHKDDPRTFVLCELLRDGAVDASVRVSHSGVYCKVPRVSLDTGLEPDEDEVVTSGPLMGASAGELWESIGGHDYADELERDLQEWAGSLADDLYRTLRDELGYLTSEECFIEECEVNDVTFEVDDECHNCDKCA